MRVRMGSQGPLTPRPAPSGRRSPPRDQEEGAGAARPADRPSFSGLVGGGGCSGGQQQQQRHRAARPPHLALRTPGRGGARLSAAGDGQSGHAVALGGRRRRRRAAWRALAAAAGWGWQRRPEGAAVAADGLAGCRYGAARPVPGRLRPAGSAWSPSSPALRLPPPASRPSASSRAARTSAVDDRKMAQKRRERSKAALPAETQLKKRDEFM